MDTIEQVGALVGIAAFLALAVLVLLYFHQAREVRRLRDWAGRAPERAAAIAAREELEAESERAEAVDAIAGPTRMGRLGERLSEFGRRAPIDPLYVGAIVIGLIVAVGFVTSGFGFLGGDDGGAQPVAEEPQQERGPGPRSPERTDVAVLNASQIPGVQGIPGLAQQFATEVTTLGYRVAAEDVGNAPGGVDLTAVMYRDGSRGEARRLASRLEPALSGTPIQIEQMSGEVIRQIGETELALLIGRNYTPPEVPEPTPAPPIEPPIETTPVP